MPGVAETNSNTNLNGMTATLEEHSKALEKLKDVPDILRQLQAALGQMNDDEESDSMEYDQESQEDNDLLLSKFRESHDYQGEKSNEESMNLLEILNESQPKPTLGPQINEDVSRSMSNIFTQRPSKEKIERVREQYVVPENCKIMSVPRVNMEIWTHPQFGSRAKQNDFSNQQIAIGIQHASVAIAKAAETVFESSKDIPNHIGEKILSHIMNAATLLGNAAQDMTLKRKLDLKPSLSKEHQPLCSNKTAPTEWLFGDDLVGQLKAHSSAARVLKPALPFRGKGYRFNPVDRSKNLNFRRPPFPQRGGQMGFNSNRQAPYSKRPRFNFPSNPKSGQ